MLKLDIGSRWFGLRRRRTGQVPSANTPPEHDCSSYTSRPDVVTAIAKKDASFSQLAVGYWEWESDDTSNRTADVACFKRLQDAFEATHGRISDVYYDCTISACVARTRPVQGRRATSQWNGWKIPWRAKREDFHFVYDLAVVPIGGGLLTRIEMLATDASRILTNRKLGACLDELYSKATDLLGVIREQMGHARHPCNGRGAARSSPRSGQLAVAKDLNVAADKESLPQPEEVTKEPAKEKVRAAATAPPGEPPPTATVNTADGDGDKRPTQSKRGQSIDDKIAMLVHDLDVIELKYLITNARTRYFAGAFAMTLAVTVVVLSVVWVLNVPLHQWWTSGKPNALGLNKSLALTLVLVLGALGALLSVVQRMSSSVLSVRYDLGRFYTFLLGAFRPLIGALAGFLTWLLVEGGGLTFPNSSSELFLGAVALGLGVAERSVGDVVTETGIADKLRPAGSSTSRPVRDATAPVP